MDSAYIAHISDDGAVQSIADHLLQTARMASAFSISDLASLNYEAGILHDIGKYSDSFQKHIRGQNIAVEHSICGAKEAAYFCKGNAAALLVQLCIAGHHTGLPDCGTRFDSSEMPTLQGRLKRKTEDYSRYKEEILVEPSDFSQFESYLLQDCKTREDLVEKYAFLVRYCFSCLTDADSIDSRLACGESMPEKLRCDFSACLSSLDERLLAFRPKTALQITRSKLQHQAYQNIEQNAEVFLLNMPTGSGKTLASMKCALRRIQKSEGRLKRIIYVIPYNSIIDQTVETFEQLFHAHTDILRHQSSFIYEEQEEYSEDYRLAARYACENWDCGIIVTTAVQFFESLYGNKRKRLRKVHNLADSVIIFDEAHLMPRNFLEPCLRGISYIARCLHSEILMLTATMPDFEMLLKKYAIENLQISNLVPDTSDFIAFQKCSYRSLGQVSDELVVKTASQYASSVIVMNSRKGAAALYRLCTGEKYHLSTYMTAYDRANVIRRIKASLAKLYADYPDLSTVPPERRITVVSTSLIEAGVDLDFVAAFRELTGLDSILQTGGRCNREGLRKDGQVFVFERSKSMNRPEMEITRGIFHDFSDISSPDAIHAYYDRLLFVEQDKFRMNTISMDCKKINLIPFRTYSEAFKMIDDRRTVSIAVCRDEISQSLLEKLRATGIIDSRKIQKYCCTVFLDEFELLFKQRVLQDYGSGIFFLTDPSYYDDALGIQFEGKDYFVE